MEPRPLDTFPAWMALTGVGVSAAIYVLGAYILSGLGAPAWVL